MRTAMLAILGCALVISPLTAQRPATTLIRDRARVTVAGTTVMIEHDAMVARDTLLLGKAIPLGAWMMGTAVPARLTTSGDLRLDDKLIPAGSYALWVLVSPDGAVLAVSRDRARPRASYDRSLDVARVPLTLERGDSALVRFRTRFAVPQHAAETMVMKYDKSHSQVIDRSVFATEPSGKPDLELVFEWQWLKWSVPVRVVR